MHVPPAKKPAQNLNPQFMEKNNSGDIPLDVLCMQLSDLTLELLKLIESGGKTPALSLKMREVELLQIKINEQKKSGKHNIKKGDQSA